MGELEIIAEIRTFLGSHHAYSGVLPEELTATTRLVRSGVLDSIGIFHLISFLEEKFKIQIDPRDVTERNFESLQTVARLVTEK